MARKKIGEMLLEEGVLDETRLRAALIEQQRWGGPLGRLLVDMKLIDERTLVDALSRQLNIPTIDLDVGEIPRPVLDLVPGELAEQYSLVPFDAPMKFLDLAMADPTNLGVLDELQIRTRRNIRPTSPGRSRSSARSRATTGAAAPSSSGAAAGPRRRPTSRSRSRPSRAARRWRSSAASSSASTRSACRRRRDAMPRSRHCSSGCRASRPWSPETRPCCARC
jgi:hypothetical protein